MNLAFKGDTIGDIGTFVQRQCCGSIRAAVESSCASHDDCMPASNCAGRVRCRDDRAVSVINDVRAD